MKIKSVDYHAYGAIAKLFECRDPEVLLDGPAGTGKSRGAGEYIHWLASEYPGCRIAVIRKTRVSLSESWMVTFEQKVLPANHESIVRTISRAHRASYDYANGSRIVLAGMDNPTRLFSTEYDLAYVNEATELSEDEWESMHRALRNGVVPWQQLLGDCNPDATHHWLNQRCLAGKTTRLLSRHADNPTLTQEYLERLRGLSGVRYKRLYQGIWCAAEGIVYEDWDPAVHLLSKYEPTRFKFYVAGKDWGFRDPGITQVWGVDGDGRMVCVAEIYMTGKTIDWWLEQDKRLDSKYPITAWIADPSEPGYIEQYRRAGFPVIEANNDIMMGLRVVEQRLKKRGDGTRGLYFLRDRLVGRDEKLVEQRQPWDTTQEFESYVYEVPKDGKAPKEKPVDRFNHGMDAQRYVAVYLDSAPRTKVTVDKTVLTEM